MEARIFAQHQNYVEFVRSRTRYHYKENNQNKTLFRFRLNVWLFYENQFDKMSFIHVGSETGLEKT